MPVNYATGIVNLLANGVTGDVVISGLPFAPKAARFWVGGCSDSIPDINSIWRISYGFAAKNLAGTITQMCYGFGENNTQATSSNQRQFSHNRAIAIITATGAAQAEYTVTSFNSDGVTLHTGANAAQNYWLHYELIGGDEVGDCSVHVFNKPATTPQTVVYTIGHKPDLLHFAHGANVGAGVTTGPTRVVAIGMGVGFAARNGQASTYLQAESGVSTMNTARAWDPAAVIIQCDATGASSINRAAVSAWGATSFSLDWTLTQNNTWPFIVLAISGVRAHVELVEKSVSPTIPQTQAIAAPFAPVGLSFLSWMAGDSIAPTVAAQNSQARMALGAVDASANQHWWYVNNNDNVADSQIRTMERKTLGFMRSNNVGFTFSTEATVALTSTGANINYNVNDSVATDYAALFIGSLKKELDVAGAGYVVETHTIDVTANAIVRADSTKSVIASALVNPGISQFRDNFQDGIETDWTNADGIVTETNSQRSLNMTPSSIQHAVSFTTAAGRQLDEIFWKIDQFAASENLSEGESFLGVYDPHGYILGFQYDRSDDSLTYILYDSAFATFYTFNNDVGITDRWFRLSYFDGDTVTWSTSSNGLSWTDRYTDNVDRFGLDPFDFGDLGFYARTATLTDWGEIPVPLLIAGVNIIENRSKFFIADALIHQPISTFRDDFEDEDIAGWTNPTGNVIETPFGYLQLQPTLGGTDSVVHFTDGQSYGLDELTFHVLSQGNYQAVVGTSSIPSGNVVGFVFNYDHFVGPSLGLVCYRSAFDTYTTYLNLSSVDFDFSLTPWFKISYANGQVTWSASIDHITWNDLHTATITDEFDFGFTGVYLKYGIGTMATWEFPVVPLLLESVNTPAMHVTADATIVLEQYADFTGDGFIDGGAIGTVDLTADSLVLETMIAYEVESDAQIVSTVQVETSADALIASTTSKGLTATAIVLCESIANVDGTSHVRETLTMLLDSSALVRQTFAHERTADGLVQFSPVVNLSGHAIVLDTLTREIVSDGLAQETITLEVDCSALVLLNTILSVSADAEMFVTGRSHEIHADALLVRPGYMLSLRKSINQRITVSNLFEGRH